MTHRWLSEMTSKRGKNKEVHYKPSASSDWCSYHVLTSSVRYHWDDTRTAKWSLFVLYTVLISVILHKIRNVLKKLWSDELRAQNFAAHYVIRDDGNAKENVTLKLTSKYFKRLRDNFNSFNLSNVVEQSGTWLCKDGVTVQVEKRKFTVVCSRYI